MPRFLVYHLSFISLLCIVCAQSEASSPAIAGGTKADERREELTAVAIVEVDVDAFPTVAEAASTALSILRSASSVKVSLRGSLLRLDQLWKSISSAEQAELQTLMELNRVSSLWVIDGTMGSLPSALVALAQTTLRESPLGNGLPFVAGSHVGISSLFAEILLGMNEKVAVFEAGMSKMEIFMWTKRLLTMVVAPRPVDLTRVPSTVASLATQTSIPGFSAARIVISSRSDESLLRPIIQANVFRFSLYGEALGLAAKALESQRLPVQSLAGPIPSSVPHSPERLAVASSLASIIRINMILEAFSSTIERNFKGNVSPPNGEISGLLDGLHSSASGNLARAATTVGEARARAAQYIAYLQGKNAPARITTIPVPLTQETPANGPTRILLFNPLSWRRFAVARLVVEGHGWTATLGGEPIAEQDSVPAEDPELSELWLRAPLEGFGFTEINLSSAGTQDAHKFATLEGEECLHSAGGKACVRTDARGVLEVAQPFRLSLDASALPGSRPVLFHGNAVSFARQHLVITGRKYTVEVVAHRNEPYVEINLEFDEADDASAGDSSEAPLHSRLTMAFPDLHIERKALEGSQVEACGAMYIDDGIDLPFSPQKCPVEVSRRDPTAQDTYVTSAGGAVVSELRNEDNTARAYEVVWSRPVDIVLESEAGTLSFISSSSMGTPMKSKTSMRVYEGDVDTLLRRVRGDRVAIVAGTEMLSTSASGLAVPALISSSTPRNIHFVSISSHHETNPMALTMTFQSVMGTKGSQEVVEIPENFFAQPLRIGKATTVPLSGDAADREASYASIFPFSSSSHLLAIRAEVIGQRGLFADQIEWLKTAASSPWFLYFVIAAFVTIIGLFAVAKMRRKRPVEGYSFIEDSDDEWNPDDEESKRAGNYSITASIGAPY